MIRRATEADRTDIERIQRTSPEAAQWFDCKCPALVADVGGTICGFLTWLELPAREVEILNIAVDPPYRRRGIATALIQEVIRGNPAAIYLEVRESNSGARELYQTLGFEELTVRAAYYQDPPEGAVVMKWSS
jgi:ribosomal-protein-alanine N-acetyltransferase